MNTFYSPTYGMLTQETMREKMLEFMSASKNHLYTLIIGTDSHSNNGSGVSFATAVTIHRVGEGGIYFFRRFIQTTSLVLQARIFQEVSYSLEIADEVLTLLQGDGISKFNLEIHVDVGENGKTREFMADVIGMVHGSGFKAKVKPYSFGASKVADRHT
ncbi:ribonuclease H-like YkuK family protein [Candidatus Gottesmanbacteria bacterium]|nr:ribonuclease H-like YkuK family protein [Candidatus Gottesmanbacteria bacterium]